MGINEDELPVMRLDDLPMTQVLDTLATSCCPVSSAMEDEEEEIEGMIEDYPIDDLNLDEEEPREELEPDDEFSEEEAGDFDYDTEED